MAEARAVRATDPRALGRPTNTRSPIMWPVMTLTLLLQLTDEEQLFAQAPEPPPAVVEQEAPAPEPAVEHATFTTAGPEA
ncbi:MAG: hypothetical protein HUU33_14590 [Flavobacteriales bacterium]|nr:hypothetical protein [Flavobacteriales bacterium]